LVHHLNNLVMQMMLIKLIMFFSFSYCLIFPF